MSQFTSPKEYVNQLIKVKSQINIYKFMIELKELFYPNINMILYEDLSKYVDREDEYCIDARYYYKYSKLHVEDYKFNLETSDPDSHIGRTLDRSKMIKDVDYRLAHVGEPVKQGGFVISNYYMMKPDSFYRLLMDIPDRYRSARQTFCDYHGFLMKVIKFYNQFQIGVIKLNEAEKMILLRKSKMQTQLVESLSYDKIDKLQYTVDKQSNEIKNLLGYAKETVNTLHEVQDDLTEVKEEVVIAKTYLREKSFVSTMNPSDDAKHHCFAATGYVFENNQVVKFITGQRDYVTKTITKKIENDNHEIIINPFYNANGIDLRYNAHERFVELRSERLNEINKINSENDTIFNKNLKKEIKKYNKSNPNNKRNYIDEKVKTPKVKARDISVKFGKLSFVYTNNNYISFQEILQIIYDINNITQESPMN